MAPQVGLESSYKRSYDNLDRGRWHLSRLVARNSVLTAREWHGKKSEKRVKNAGGSFSPLTALPHRINLRHSAHRPFNRVYVLAPFAWASNQDCDHRQGWRIGIVHRKFLTATFTRHVFVHSGARLAARVVPNLLSVGEDGVYLGEAEQSDRWLWCASALAFASLNILRCDGPTLIGSMGCFA